MRNLRRGGRHLWAVGALNHRGERSSSRGIDSRQTRNRHSKHKIHRTKNKEEEEEASEHTKRFVCGEMQRRRRDQRDAQDYKRRETFQTKKGITVSVGKYLMADLGEVAGENAVPVPAEVLGAPLPLLYACVGMEIAALAL